MLAPTPASPESAGLSQAALDRLEDHLKRRYIDAGRFPGMQTLVYRRGNWCIRPCRALPMSSARRR